MTVYNALQIFYAASSKLYLKGLIQVFRSCHTASQIHHEDLNMGGHHKATPCSKEVTPSVPIASNARPHGPVTV